jgi:hypothetical protein
MWKGRATTVRLSAIRVQGSEFSGLRAQGSGLRVQGSGFRVQSSQGSGLRAQGLGLRAQGSGLRAQGSSAPPVAPFSTRRSSCSPSPQTRRRRIPRTKVPQAAHAETLSFSWRNLQGMAEERFKILYFPHIFHTKQRDHNQGGICVSTLRNLRLRLVKHRKRGREKRLEEKRERSKGLTPRVSIKPD